MTITRLNPDTLHKNPAFTQVAVVTNPAKWIFVGGQNAVDAQGNLVGAGDIGLQSEQAMKNVMAALDAAGATLADVFKLTVYIVQGQDIAAAAAGAMRVQPPQTPAPTITGVLVAGLANPAYLVEIEAVAVIGEGANG